MAKKVSKRKTKRKGKSKKPVGYQGYKGRHSGLPVSAYWVKLFNAQPKSRMTDDEIIKTMAGEFTKSKRYDAIDVVMFRNRYNNGKLSGQSGKRVSPRVGEYVKCPHCKKNLTLPFWGDKKAHRAPTLQKTTRTKPPSVSSAKKKASKKKVKSNADKKSK